QSQGAGSFSNVTTQEASTEPIVNSASGEVENVGPVEAGGDAVVSKSSAAANAPIGEKASQSNTSGQSQTAGNGGFIQQDQEAGSFVNIGSQGAVTLTVVSSASGEVANAAPIDADGDAVVSKSSATANAPIGQWLDQHSGSTQSQVAGDGNPVSQNQGA